LQEAVALVTDRYHPSTTNIHKYLVLEDLTRQLNVPMFAERAAIRDSPDTAEASSRACVHGQGPAGQGALAD